MNAGRFVGASVAVFIVRTLLNFLFYGVAMRGQYEAIAAAHPGLLRQVTPAFITIDLVVAFLLTYLLIKTAAVFGPGIKGGVVLSILLAILGPVAYLLYNFFGVTYYPVDLLTIESVYQIAAYAIQGAVAAAIYKPA